MIAIEDCADCDENFGDRNNENYGDHRRLRHVNDVNDVLLIFL